MQYNISFSALPMSLDELKALPEASLIQPQYTAALAIAALCSYPTNQEAALQMLAFLQGPKELSVFDKQFLADRFRGKDYVPRSFFNGASPGNNYTPTQPYTLTLFENPYSRNNIEQGY